MADYPLSLKGVILHEGRVLLLVNDRNEWDLPGGRPEPGEELRAALLREVREETGIVVTIRAELEKHLYEVLPDRFVRIKSFVIEPVGSVDVTLSDEHEGICWIPLDELDGDIVDGRLLPAGYLGAIRMAEEIYAS